jgi:hypothetical protein
MGPFGGLLAGGLASRFGAPATQALCGVGCIAATLVFAVRLPRLNRIIESLHIQRGLAAVAVATASGEPVAVIPLRTNGEEAT